MGAVQPGTKSGLILKIGVFAFLAVAGLYVFTTLIYYLAASMLLAATLGVFAAGAVGNALVLRIYERGRLADIGLQWNVASQWNLLLGVVGGGGAACLVLGVPLLTGFARLRPDPNHPANAGSFLLVSLALVFGAVGEELMFRGYGFQLLLARIGPFATILPVSVLFGVFHANNPNVTPLAVVNTIGWGVVLGVAFLRSGDLWLPIGLHFGWNWVLPLAGVELSGFTMNIAGYAMEWKVSDLWSGGAYGPEGGLLTSLVLVLLGLYLWKAPIQGQRAFLLRARREG